MRAGLLAGPLPLRAGQLHPIATLVRTLTAASPAPDIPVAEALI